MEEWYPLLFRGSLQLRCSRLTKWLALEIQEQEGVRGWIAGSSLFLVHYPVVGFQIVTVHQACLRSHLFVRSSDVAESLELHRMSHLASGSQLVEVLPLLAVGSAVGSAVLLPAHCALVS